MQLKNRRVLAVVSLLAFVSQLGVCVAVEEVNVISPVTEEEVENKLHELVNWLLECSPVTRKFMFGVSDMVIRAMFLSTGVPVSRDDSLEEIGYKCMKMVDGDSVFPDIVALRERSSDDEVQGRRLIAALTHILNRPESGNLRFIFFGRKADNQVAQVEAENDDSPPTYEQTILSYDSPPTYESTIPFDDSLLAYDDLFPKTEKKTSSLRR